MIRFDLTREMNYLQSVYILLFYYYTLQNFYLLLMVKDLLYFYTSTVTTIMTTQSILLKFPLNNLGREKVEYQLPHYQPNQNLDLDIGVLLTTYLATKSHFPSSLDQSLFPLCPNQGYEQSNFQWRMSRSRYILIN